MDHGRLDELAYRGKLEKNYFVFQDFDSAKVGQEYDPVLRSRNRSMR